MSGGISLELVNLDKEARKYISENRDFLIDKEFDMVKLDTLELVLQDTIYSSKRFGPRRGDKPEVLAYKYSCDCTALYGDDKIGEECPICGTLVVEREFPIEIFGWIKLPTRILSPIGAHFLQSFMTGKIKGEKKNAFEKLKNGFKPFNGDHLFNLYDRFEEIVSPYVKNKAKLEFLLANKDRLFMTMFPVISKRLRRFRICMNGDVPEVRADQMSVLYTNIIGTCNMYEASTKTTEYKKYAATNFLKNTLELYTLLASNINGTKEDIIKGEIYSTRNPYSARILVEPDTELKMGRGDVCRIGYDVFRTIHKEFIMNQLLEDGYPITIADRITDVNFKIDDNIKARLRQMVEENELWITANRPPSIDMSALLSLQIMGLTDDNIIFVNPIICGLLRLDFDGDTMSHYVIPKDLEWRMKVVQNPRRFSLAWNREVSSAYGPINDQVVTTHLMLDGDEVEIYENKVTK